MFVKSKFCLECDEKLESYDDNFLVRSNYCEICKPNFRSKEVLKRSIFMGFAIIPTIFGVGVLLQKPAEKPLSVAKTEIASIAPVPKPSQKVENNRPNNAAQPKNVEANQQIALLSKQPETQPAKQTSDKKTPQIVREVSQSLVPEVVYLCGAKTKKGTPCSRKVKGSVRCWQHLGQEAMLPAKELKIQ